MSLTRLNLNKKVFSKNFINKKVKILNFQKSTTKMTYYIVSSGTCFLTKKQIESCLKAISVIVKKARKHLVNCLNFNIPITRKPRFSRMGSGKGRIRKYVAKVHMNSTLFIFNNLPYFKVLKLFKAIEYRLPIKIYLK